MLCRSCLIPVIVVVVCFFAVAYASDEAWLFLIPISPESMIAVFQRSDLDKKSLNVYQELDSQCDHKVVLSTHP